MLRNDEGEVLISFSKSIGLKDSIEVTVLAILEGLRLYVGLFQESLIVESDPANAIS